MNDSRKRLDNIFSEFINLVDNSDSEDQVVYSPLLELLNDALNKDNLYLSLIHI